MRVATPSTNANRTQNAGLGADGGPGAKAEMDRGEGSRVLENPCSRPPPRAARRIVGGASSVVIRTLFFIFLCGGVRRML